MKKQSNLSQLMGYAGDHRYLTYLSLFLSAVSAVMALLPFVFLFFIIRKVIEVSPNYAQAASMVRNGWMAVLSALLSMAVYFAALMCSHLSAFRIAGNIRKALMAHIAQLPLGFIGEMGSGKIRRIVNDSSAATETYLAHQLPDMSAAITTPVCMIVMLFLLYRFYQQRVRLSHCAGADPLRQRAGGTAYIAELHFLCDFYSHHRHRHV